MAEAKLITENGRRAELHLREPVSEHLVGALGNTPGIAQATRNDRYSVSIWRGEMFSWEDVLEGIKQVLPGVDIQAEQDGR